MLDRRASVRILDFGIARLADSSLTATSAHLGTIPYMSPEQIKGEELDPRTDIYSLGVVAYELVSLRPAFEGTNTAASCTAS